MMAKCSDPIRHKTCECDGTDDDGLLRGEAHPREDVEMRVLDEIRAEVERAEAGHAPMNSPHEGYAVILEELDELKAEVWKGGSVPRDPAAMRREAIEVAAMAVRFVRDLCS